MSGMMVQLAAFYNGSTHSNPFCSQFFGNAICITTALLLQMEVQQALIFCITIWSC